MSTRIITVTSGKGGTGKSVVAANLAWSLAASGKSTLLIDADTGLANQDILLGIEPQGSLVDAINGNTGWKENSVAVAAKLDVIAGVGSSSSVPHLDPMSLGSGLNRIISQAPHEFVVVDTPSGLTPETIMFASMASFSLIVISPEPTSLADGFRLVMAVDRADVEVDWKVCLNMAPRAPIAADIIRRFRQAVTGEISVGVEDWGSIPMDPAMLRAVRLRQPLAVACAKSPAAAAINALAKRVMEWESKDEDVSLLESLRPSDSGVQKAA